MHSLDIMHRDVKLENILFKYPDKDDLSIVLIGILFIYIIYKN